MTSVSLERGFDRNDIIESTAAKVKHLDSCDIARTLTVPVNGKTTVHLAISSNEIVTFQPGRTLGRFYPPFFYSTAVVHRSTLLIPVLQSLLGATGSKIM